MSNTVQISATQVNDLRARTGAGLMDCKRALVETQGNVDAAIDFLRKKGLASAAKKADRTSNDGLVTALIAADQTSGTLVQVSCETDFVAKTDDFKAFNKSLAEHIASHSPANVDALLTQTLASSGHSVKDTLAGLIAKLGENMTIRGFATAKASLVEQYIHLGGKVGVILAIETGKPATAQLPAVKTLAKDICMHIAASSPVCVSRDQVPADLVAKEKEIAVSQAAGKPAQAIEKIVTGKLEKFYAQSALLEQPFVKNPDQSVKALVEATAKAAGDSITVKSFTRLQVGA